MLTFEEKIKKIAAKLSELQAEFENASADQKYWIKQEIDRIEEIERDTRRKESERYG
jgi:hypothetical protein